jgi:hypothetical protein
LKNFYLQGNFCAYWLLTLNYILSYFWNAIWLFYQLFIHACSEANVRKKKIHYFSASSVKRPDGHVLASGCARLYRSLIWQHAVRTSMYHVRTQAFFFLCQNTYNYFLPILLCRVVCIFSRIDPEILAFSAHLFSFPDISFDFPYSLNLWFFLEYWNL